jgi:hypothetical protein
MARSPGTNFRAPTGLDSPLTPKRNGASQKWTRAMMDSLHGEPTSSALFVAYLLAGNVRYEEDLVD